MPDGATSFPERDLIVFLTASVILCTLLLADGLLPLLSPRVAEASNEQELSRAAIRVLEGTLRELQAMLASDENTQYDPALRLTIAHYWVRLARARESVDDTCSQQIGALATQVREVQEKARPMPFMRKVATTTARRLLTTPCCARCVARWATMVPT